MIVEKAFHTGEIELNYAEGPENGPPLLLLHGTSNRWQAFIRHIPAFLPRWHVYAPDHRGHGRSAKAPNYGFGYYYGDTVRFIDEVIREPPVIFGHSLGGRLALTIAAKRPNKTRAIILGDSSLSTPRQSGGMGSGFTRLIELLEENKTVQEIFQALKERSVEDFDPIYTLNRAKNLSMVDPRMLKSIVDHPDVNSPYSHFHGYDPDEFLSRVRCPVLILQAEKGMLSDEDVRRALEILPEAYNVKLRDMPHEFLMRETEPVLKVVMTFLESLR
jgi:pimeloyl-ACP methyl ester carboxylesterase